MLQLDGYKHRKLTIGELSSCTDWARLSQRWRDELDARVRQLEHLRGDLVSRGPSPLLDVNTQLSASPSRREPQRSG